MSDEQSNQPNQDNQSNQSNQSNLKGHHLFVTYEDEIHRLLKLICQQQGLTMNEVVTNIIIDHVKAQSKVLFNNTVNINTIKSNQTIDMFQTLLEDEIKELCIGLKDGVKRKAPQPYLTELRSRIMETLRKNRNISQELSDEVRLALKEYRDYLSKK